MRTAGDFMAVNLQRFDFLALSVTTPEKITQNPKPDTLEAALFGPLPLWVSPILHDGMEFHIASRAWLFNKFLRGLPYLVLETERARNGGELVDSDAKSIRGEFGLLFEAYVRWLFGQWFDSSPVEIVAPYFIKTVDGEWREKDVALLLGQVAFPIEIKALVPPLRLRQSGELADWLNYFAHIASQVVEAADAMVDGRAFRADRSTLLPDVKKAFPCAVTYETTPFRQPIVMPFESALATKLRRDIFMNGDSIGPLQLFDVEMIESWDEFFDLPSDSERLLALLQERARSVMHRYSSFSRFQIDIPAGTKKKESVMAKATAEAAEAVLARANNMSAQVPLPDFLQPFGHQLRTVGGPWPQGG